MWLACFTTVKKWISVGPWCPLVSRWVEKGCSWSCSDCYPKWCQCKAPCVLGEVARDQGFKVQDAGCHQVNQKQIHRGGSPSRSSDKSPGTWSIKKGWPLFLSFFFPLIHLFFLTSMVPFSENILLSRVLVHFSLFLSIILSTHYLMKW